MFPFLYKNGDTQIPTYGILVLLAFTAAFALVNARARRIGISPERMIPIYLASAGGGLLGARILYSIAVEPQLTFANPLSIFSCSTGGLAFYGGLLGGSMAAFATAAFLKMPGWKVADILAPALILGLGIGRLGCFFAGCCHGAPAPIGLSPIALLPEHALHGQLWLSGTFPFLTSEVYDEKNINEITRLLNIPLYPTQLWSAFVGLSIAGGLSLLWNRRAFDGQIIGCMLVIEPISRILIESFRADERGYVVTTLVNSVPKWLPPGFSRAGDVLPDGTHSAMIGITTSQFIALAMIIVGIGILVLRRSAGVAPEVALDEDMG